MPLNHQGLMRLFNAVAVIGVLALAVLVPGCTPRPAEGFTPIAFESWQKYELYFGFARPDGTEITPPEFDRFVNDQVTPRFPDGLTLLQTHGQWRGEDQKLIRENGRLLVVLSPPGDASAAKIAQIRDAYKRAFSQDSVLIVTQPAGVSF